MQMTNWYKRRLYQPLISANKETARNHIPKMSKKKKVKSIKWSSSYGRQERDLKNSMNSTNRIPKKAGQGEKLKTSNEILEKLYLDIAES